VSTVSGSNNPESGDLEARLAAIEAQLQEVEQDLRREATPTGPKPEVPNPDTRPDAAEQSALNPDDHPDPDGVRQRRVLEAAISLRKEIEKVRMPLGKQGIDRRSALGMIIPMQMAAAVTVAAFAGRWLDNRFAGGGGVVTLIFLGLGIVAAVRMVMQTMRDMNRK
jgi:F0F1-type ATP synthase assembly protein I